MASTEVKAPTLCQPVKLPKFPAIRHRQQRDHKKTAQG